MAELESMSFKEKVAESFRSRKWWLTVVVLVLAVFMRLAGQIDQDTMSWMISVAAGVYVGSLAVEDGLRLLGLALYDFLESREK